MPPNTGRKSWLAGRMNSFTKYLLDTYYGPGTLLDIDTQFGKYITINICLSRLLVVMKQGEGEDE